MARRLAALVLAAAAVCASGGAAGADERDGAPIDAAHSRVSFSVTHLYVSRVTGVVPIVSGTVTLPAGGIVPTAVTATFDARHLDSGDRDRDEDLQGPDWFDTKRFPTWTFTSTSVTAGANGGFAVDGLLTVHGVAQPERLTVTITRGLPHPAYHAVTTVDRHAFGMRTTPIDALIGNEVTIVVDVALR